MIRLLGQGGMGTVYEAEDTQLKRPVAIKLLPHDVAENAEMLARFQREGQGAARLNHPNVVAIYDIGTSDGAHFIVMELLTGGSAQDYLKAHGTMAWDEATRVMIDVCRGVREAHRAGLIHRDIKPANILRSREGTVKLGDFGLVKSAGHANAASGGTSVGNVIGTPHYMSPEQIQGTRIDARSDLYSLGATYYALLTGMPPYSGNDPVQVLFAHCSRPAPDPRTVRPDVPDGCARIIAKAMAKDRADRYADAAALMADLVDLLQSSTSPLSQPAFPGSSTSHSVWGSDDDSAAASHAYSLADGYLAERTVPNATQEIRKSNGRLWRLAGVLLLAAAIAVSVGYFAMRPGVHDGLPAEKDDWASLGTAADNAIRDRQAPAMKRVLERFKTLKNREGLPADDGLRQTVSRLSTRLEKAIAFRERITEKGHVLGMSGHVSSVAFSPDDHLLAAGNASADGGVTVYDSWTGEKHTILGPRRNNVSINVHAIAFSHDSETIAAACGDVPGIKTWQIDTGKERSFALDKSVRRATSVAFSPTSRKLVAGFEPFGDGFGKVYLKTWDIDTGREPFTFKLEHRGRVESVAFTATGQQIASGSNDKRVVMWDAETGRIWREVHPDFHVTAVVCAPRGGTLAVAGVDGKGNHLLQFWDYVGDRKIATLTLPHGACRCLAYSADGSMLAAGSGSKIMLWNAETQVLAATLTGHGFDVASLAFPARGGILASGGDDQTMQLWDVTRFLK